MKPIVKTVLTYLILPFFYAYKWILSPIFGVLFIASLYVLCWSGMLLGVMVGTFLDAFDAARHVGGQTLKMFEEGLKKGLAKETPKANGKS